MNPNPLTAQNPLIEQKQKARSRVKLAVFCVLAMHLALFGVLLIQGCKREETHEAQPAMDTNAFPPFVEGTNATNAELLVPPPATNVVEAMTNLAPPIVENTATASVSEYAVIKGDSFYTIAKKFGVPMNAIQAANPTVDPKRLQIGQKLIIPAPTTPTPDGTAAPATTTSGTDASYTVKSGDTLTKIAAEHHTTVKALRAANNLTTDRIKVGQKLVIPSGTSAQ